MKYLLLRGLLILFLCGSSFLVFAQKKGKQSNPTSNTDWNVNSARPPKSGKKIRVIYMSDLKGIRPGSKCVDENTYKRGFRYEQVPKSGPGSMTQEGIFFHNLGVKTILLFRNGPFWHIRTKNQIKKCRRKTGDYMG